MDAKLFFICISSTVFSLSFFVVSCSAVILQRVSSDNFGRFAKYSGLESDNRVTQYAEQDGKPKIVAVATISGAEITDHEKLHCQLHGVELSSGSGTVEVSLGAGISVLLHFKG